jgi:hypothetical protein
MLIYLENKGYLQQPTSPPTSCKSTTVLGFSSCDAFGTVFTDQARDSNQGDTVGPLNG